MADERKVPLQPEHRGMRAKLPTDPRRPGVRWALEELARLLELTAEHYYGGDLSAPDQLFQLWCVGEDARKRCVAEGRGVEVVVDEVPHG